MKKITYICLIIFVFTAVFAVTNIEPSYSQLVIIGGKYEVTKVDHPKRRLEALNYKKKAGIVYILIDGNTKVVHPDGTPTLWTKIKTGDIVTVYGGLTWDIKIKAKKIILPR
ncbi:MAG: hypothetical protein ABIH00_11725 [Armatimonadota bacterium]